MKHRFFRITTVFMLLVGVFSTNGTIRAQEPTITDTSIRERVSSKLPQGIKADPDAAIKLGARSDGTVNVVIELNGEPTALTYSRNLNTKGKSQAISAAQAQLAVNDQAQRQLLGQLQKINATVMYRTQRVINGIAAQVNVRDLPAIRSMAGVKAVRPLIAKERDHNTSMRLIGAPRMWDSTIGYDLTGEGISIAVIDTGIDYLHANFGGPGTQEAYQANDPTVITDTNGFPTAKVVGGYDFVGDDYAAGLNDDAKPDRDPLDCNGHGSHVAGTSAGFGVTTAGATYTGAYTAGMNLKENFRIGPGVAPHADLYALKVFGCDGSTNYTDAAIEWAVDPNGDGDLSDHVDVINMSLGSDFGGADDSSTIASDNAVLAGVIVVTSAGNSGDTNYISGSPGSAKRVIATASSVDAGSLVDAFRVSDATATPSLNTLHAGSNSVAYPWDNPNVTLPPTTTLPLTAPLYVPPVGQRSGCNSQPFSVDTKAAIVGKIVLLDWNEPSCGGSVARTRNVRLAGGVGALLIDNSGGNPDAFDLFITGDSIIPSQSIPKAVGDALKAEFAANPNVKATFSREYNQSFFLEEPQLVDTMSDFSSRGPNAAVLKPDVSAPGQSIFSTGVGTGNLGANLSGTSMAAPHVAGSMALLRQEHPDWSVEELKALIMNTATQDIRTQAAEDSVKYGPSRQGAGRIILPKAAAENVVAYSQDSGQVSMFFGSVEVLGSTSLSKNFIVENKGASSHTYALSLENRSTIPGVGYSLSTDTVTVDAGEVAIVTLTMTATASEMLHSHDPALNLDQTGQGLGRFWQSEAGAYINFVEQIGPIAAATPASAVAPDLRLPVFATARPASLMQAKDSNIELGTTDQDSFAVELQGSPVVNTQGGAGEDIISLVQALELQAVSPNETFSSGPAESADLQFIGAMSDFNVTQFMTDTTVAIGFSTYADWVTPQAGYETWFEIYIDTDGDGSDDYAVFNWNLTEALGGTDATDDFLTAVYDFATDEITLDSFLNGFGPGSLDTYPFNNNVVVFPITAELIGLTDADADFTYQVVTYQRYTDGPVDISKPLYYDAGNPGIDTSGGVAGIPAYFDVPGAGNAILVDFDRAAASKSGAMGLLLLHHHNIKGRRAEVVNFNYDSIKNKIFLPLITK